MASEKAVDIDLIRRALFDRVQFQVFALHENARALMCRAPQAANENSERVARDLSFIPVQNATWRAQAESRDRF